MGFLLAGVQKAGTTSLFGMLAKHPQISTPSQKELHFFDDDRRDWADPDYTWYHEKINWSDGATIAGESTPMYIFWPGAMERIKTYNPDVRLVFSFRDPVERAFSQWCMERERRASTWDFARTIRAVRPKEWPRTASDVGEPYRAMVARGYYGQQLAHVLELFPAEQILPLDYHRTFRDLQVALDRITDFLGVSRFPEPPQTMNRRSQPEILDGTPPRARDVMRLVRRYADDLEEFSTLSGIDVSSWPTAQVAAGSMTAEDLAEALAAKVIFSADAPSEAAEERRRKAERRRRRKAEAAPPAG